MKMTKIAAARTLMKRTRSHSTSTTVLDVRTNSKIRLTCTNTLPIVIVDCCKPKMKIKDNQIFVSII